MFCNRICKTAGDLRRTGIVPSKLFTYFGFVPSQTPLPLVLDRKCFIHALLSASLPLHSFNNPDTWLNRHDRESRYLHGVVRLIEGMPVAMVDHIYRCADKRMRFTTSNFPIAVFSKYFMTPLLSLASKSQYFSL